MLRSALLAATAAALLAPAAASATVGWNPAQPVNAPADSYWYEAGVATDGTPSLAIADGSWSTYTVGNAAPYSAAFTFSDPISITGCGDVDTDAHGTTTVVWCDGGSAWIATRPVGGSFGTPVELGAADGNAVLDVSPGGAAIVLWSENGKLVGRVRAASGQLGSKVTVVDGTAGDVHAAIADTGEALVTYTDGASVTRSSVRPAGGSFPATGTVMPGTQPVVDGLAMNARGDAQLVLETQAGGSTHFGAAFRPAGGSLVETDAVSGVITDWSDPVAAIAPNGDGSVAWPANEHTQAVVRRGTAYDATPVDLGVGDSGYVAAAFDTNSTAFFAWDVGDDHGQRTISGGWAPGGAHTLQDVKVLGTVTSSLDQLDLDPDGHGNVMASWLSDGGDLELAWWERPEPPVPTPPTGGGMPAPGSGSTPAGANASPHGMPRAVSRVRVSALRVSRGHGRAVVRFRLSVPARVTLALQHRVGRKWKRVRTVVVAGRVGANRATLSLKRLAPGRYRVVAKAGGARVAAGLRF